MIIHVQRQSIISFCLGPVSPPTGFVSSSGTQTDSEHTQESSDSMLKASWENVVNSQKAFEITNECYIHRIYDLFEQARRESCFIICSPYFEIQSPSDRRIFMIMEFLNREPRSGNGHFTISWSFLRSLLTNQPQFKDLFRVLVDCNLLQNPEDNSHLLELMKETFEAKYVAHNLKSGNTW